MAETSTSVVVVNNHDIAGLNSRMNRFIEELVKSVSSGTSQLNQFDQQRLTTYLDAIDTYHGWVIAQPNLDLPETHPRAITLTQVVPPITVENDSINDLVRLLTIARDEIVNSQSARDAAGLNPFDSARLRNIINKSRKFLSDYIVPTNPLDLPESSPAVAQSGPGRTGI